MTTHEQPLACSLSSPELVERIREWLDVASHATSRHIEEGCVVSTYPSSPRLLQRLRDLIAAEADCCPSLKFDIEQRGEEIVVALQVRPNGIEMMPKWTEPDIRDLLERYGSADRP